MKTFPMAALLVSLLLVVCASTASAASSWAATGLPEPLPPPALDLDAENAAPADLFLAALARHCGQSFAGRVLTDVPASADDAFAGKPLVMQVRDCGPDRIRVPFHVGDDHSRTWVLSRTPTGLRLKHDHRHADGRPDAVTMYGGDSAGPGTATRQAFPVDAESIAMFGREGLAASVDNTWAMEIEPGQRFLYELSRPGGRLFQVEFDLTRPVPDPPAPWGSDPASP